MIVDWADAPFPNPHEQLDAMRQHLEHAVEQQAKDAMRLQRATVRSRAFFGAVAPITEFRSRDERH